MLQRYAVLVLIVAAMLLALAGCEGPLSGLDTGDSISDGADSSETESGGNGNPGGNNETGESGDSSDSGSDPPASTNLLSLSFDGNGATDGEAPDVILFEAGSYVGIPGQATLVHQDSAEGDGSGEASLASARFIIGLPDPPADPYLAFAGWNTQADGLGDTFHPGSVHAFEASQKVYARWFNEADVFQVQLEIEQHQGAASWIGMDISGFSGYNNYAIGDSVVMLDLETLLERTGNTYSLPERKLFGGWRNIGSSILYEPGDIWELVNSSSNYLRFRLELIDAPFLLLLDYNGADGLAGSPGAVGPASLEFDEYDALRAEDLPVPVREGLEFKGWWNPAEIAYIGDYFMEMPAQDLSVIAHWAAVIEFETNGGSAVPAIEILLDAGQSETASAPDPPVKTNYVFDGWFSNPELTEAWDFSSPVSAGMQLYAAWRIAPEFMNQNGHSISFVDWLFDPPTLEVRYRMDSESSIEWELPGLTEGIHYIRDDSQPDIVSGGRSFRVSRVQIPDRADLPEGDYSEMVEFRIIRDSITVLSASRLLDIPENRTPNISWFSQTTFTRNSPNSLGLTIAVWDYETRPENLTVTISSSNSNASFVVGGAFTQSTDVAHHSHGNLSGVPVQVSSRNFTMALNGSEAITTTLTITVTDADGASRTDSRTITIN